MTTSIRTLTNAPMALALPDGHIITVRCDLEWTIEEPAAVKMTLRAGDHEPVVWVFGRDLLLHGVGAHRPVGDGDVTIRAASERATRIILRSTDEGDADLLIFTGLLIPFLDACEDACASGSPAEDERMTAWVDALLLAWEIT